MRNAFITLCALLVLALAGCGQGDIMTRDNTTQEAPTSTEATATFYPLGATAMAVASAEPTSTHDASATQSAERSTTPPGTTPAATTTTNELTATFVPSDVAPQIPQQSATSSATPTPSTARLTTTPEQLTPPTTTVASTWTEPPSPTWAPAVRDILLPEGSSEDGWEAQQIELPAAPGIPARQLRLPRHNRDTQTYTIHLALRQGDTWHEVAQLALPEGLQSVSRMRPIALEPSRLWLKLEGTSGPTDCDMLLSLAEARLKLHYARCDRWLDAQIFDLDGDEIGELVITHRHYAGPSAPTTSQDLSVYQWNPVAEELAQWQLAPLGEEAPDQRIRQLNRAVELAQAGLWKKAERLIDMLTGKQLPNRQANLTANFILLSWNKRLSLLTNLRRDPEFSKWPPYIFQAQLDYGDYEGAIDTLRRYTPGEIFERESILFSNIMLEKLTHYAERALQAMPDLAAAHFVRAIGLAHGDDVDEVDDSLRRAATLAPDEPLFQQALAYWERRAR